MLRTGESETEILLGNKQLLGIFFVAAILLGAAFTGGYMVGRGPTGKKALPAAAANEPASAANTDTAGGETHSIPADSTDAGSAAQEPTNGGASEQAEARAQKPVSANQEPPLGSPERKRFEQAHPAPADPASANSEGFAPQPGQEFLQVVAVGRDEAGAIADVLRKKGFEAHAVPKPGNTALYRVLIGPIKDAADLSATRDSLRKTGFRDVIVQKY